MNVLPAGRGTSRLGPNQTRDSPVLICQQKKKTISDQRWRRSVWRSHGPVNTTSLRKSQLARLSFKKKRKKKEQLFPEVMRGGLR